MCVYVFEREGDVAYYTYVLQVTILEADNLHLEETKTTLETSESKLKARIQSILADNDESLSSIRQNNRNKIRVLENRIAELEGQLEEETTYRTETEKVCHFF